MTLDLARQQIKLIKNINVPIVTYSRSNEHRSIGSSEPTHIFDVNHTYKNKIKITHILVEIEN